MRKKKKWFGIVLYILLSCMFIYFVSILLGLKVLTIFVFFILVNIELYRNIKVFTQKKMLIFYLGAFIAKLGLLIYDTAFKVLPMTSGDFKVYYMFANEIIEKSNGILGIISLSTGTDIYSKFNALTYVLLENNYNVSYLFTFIFSLILTVYLYKTSLLIMNDEIKAGNVVLLWMITPLEFMYSITFLKEIFIQMLFMISFYNIILYFKTNNKTKLLMAIVFAAGCSFCHSGMISILIIYGIIGAFYNHKNKKLKINVKGLVILLISVGVLMVTPIGRGLTSRFNKIQSADDLIGSTQGTAGSTSYISETPKDNIDFITQTPYRFIMLAISPLPWQVNSISTAVAWVLDGVLQYFIFLFYCIYMIKIHMNNKEEKLYKELVISLTILTWLIFSWGTNNYGTAMRHRLKIYPMTLITICCYWNRFASVVKIKKIDMDFSRI